MNCVTAIQLQMFKNKTKKAFNSQWCFVHVELAQVGNFSVMIQQYRSSSEGKVRRDGVNVCAKALI